jgi:hypothetical protein
MSTPGPGPLLSGEEYERRKRFLEGIKILTKAEYIEIVRILQKYNAEYSENTNGIFFNLCTVPQTVFNALELFLMFTQKNRQNLEDREQFMSTLSTGLKIKMNESKPPSDM